MDLVLNSEIKELVDKLKVYKNESNESEYITTVSLLVDAIEAKDQYTARHTERVTLFSLVLFDEIYAHQETYKHEFKKEERAVLKKAALLHDVGKVGIATEILIKPSGLTDDEFDQIKQHSLYGYQIASFIDENEDVLEAIKYHHERFDGQGYPEGLAAEQIPYLAAVIAVADTYDAMTSDRPYRKGLDREIAYKEILSCSGTQFNPSVVKAFKKVFEQNIL